MPLSSASNFKETAEKCTFMERESIITWLCPLVAEMLKGKGKGRKGKDKHNGRIEGKVWMRRRGKGRRRTREDKREMDGKI